MVADAVVTQNADVSTEIGQALWRHRYGRRYLALFSRGILRAGRWLARLNQAGKLRPEILETIIGALHESRRRRSAHLLLHDYRHLICRPDQESERNY